MRGMSSFDPKGLRERRRGKVRNPEELRQLQPGNLGALDVSKLVLSEIPAGTALRLSMALMLQILQTRVEAGALSGLNRERMRQKIVELLLEIGDDAKDGDPESLPASPTPAK